MQSVYLRQLADPQAASFVPGLDPDLEPGSPITIPDCPSLSVFEVNFQSQLPLYLRLCLHHFWQNTGLAM